MKVPLRHETFSDNLDFEESVAHINPWETREVRGVVSHSQPSTKHWKKNMQTSAICELPTFCPNLWISGQTSRLPRVDPRKNESPLCLVMNASVWWLLGLEVHTCKENRSMLICIYSTGVISYIYIYYIYTRINAHYNHLRYYCSGR